MSRTIPAVTENYVVTIGPKCHVMCVDAESGEFKWAIDLEEGMKSLIEWRKHDIEALEAKRLAIGGLGNL